MECVAQPDAPGRPDPARSIVAAGQVELLNDAWMSHISDINDGNLCAGSIRGTGIHLTAAHSSVRQRREWVRSVNGRENDGVVAVVEEHLLRPTFDLYLAHGLQLSRWPALVEIEPLPRKHHDSRSVILHEVRFVYGRNLNVGFLVTGRALPASGSGRHQ